MALVAMTPGPAPYSAIWAQVAGLRPVLRPHVVLHRQYFRGALWYVMEDPTGGKFFRFSPEAYALIGLMDGRRTLEDIATIGEDRLGVHAPTQDEIVQLLSQLHVAGVLTTDRIPDLEEIAERDSTMRRKKMMQSMRNPLGVKVPLFAIDGFITATMPLVRFMFTWIGFLAWLALLVYGTVLAGIHWQALTGNLVDRVLSGNGIALLLIAYPLVKLLHELGHGYAVKHWGGQVREVGVMFLVFMPVPYVDASAAIGFPSKRQRIVVGAAGIMVELAVASCALIAWTQMEPGMARALMFNVMLIGGVSTLLFNGNPLLRFDGYYVFSDLIEVPNLGQRSNKYLAYLIRRHLFRLDTARTPVTAPGERKWLFGYAVLAFVYRTVIMLGISLFVAGKFFFIGIALAIWSVILMIGLPILKAIVYLASAAELETRRKRAFVASAALVATIAGPLVVIPVPDASIAWGVVVAPGETRVMTRTGGWLTDMAASGHDVAGAQVQVAQLTDPLADARARLVTAQLRQAEIQLAASDAVDPLQARIDQSRRDLAQSDLDRLSELRDALQVLAPQEGRFQPLIGAD
ncbi:peptidase M50, partial [uncultured Tateyamaria sp.]|uniref:peptidase M50 n=1 Tax=uncultured Tateyamaria sp. TaxID=455651 RepID=UPI002637FD31